ncbi:MAG: RNA polymerase sigma factor [Bacillota bacterium]
MSKTDLQLVGENTVDQWGRFIEIISPFRSRLWNYCRKLTGSPWDAEDLLQDTLLKSFASLSALSHRQQPLQTKAFLFRVATNHWIDQCRRMKVQLDEYVEEHQVESNVGDSLEVNEALELLVHYLTPKQAVVFILMESFSFTAKETAELIATTETAVNAILYRARANLHKLKSTEDGMTKNHKHTPQQFMNPEIMKRFLDTFNRKDYQGLANFLIDEATFSFVSMNSSEYGKDTIMKKSLNPNKGTKLLKDLFIYADTLWGQPAIIILLNTEHGQMLNNINTLEWERDRIVRWKDYSFCRDFMQAAANELVLPLSDFI